MAQTPIRNAIQFLGVMTVIGVVGYLSKGRAIGLSFVEAMAIWAVFVLSLVSVAVIVAWVRRKGGK